METLEEKEEHKQILVGDTCTCRFSDQIPKAIDLAFILPVLNAKVELLNVYYSPPFTISSINDSKHLYIERWSCCVKLWNQPTVKLQH